MDQLPERRLECGECKKPIAVIYTEIVGKTITRIGMCNECPFLREKLKGQAVLYTKDASAQADVVCGGCGLTLDTLRMGSDLGCSLCYEIFAEELLYELTASERIPSKAGFKKGVSLHTGRRPGQGKEKITSSLRLYTLHQALNETLGREDYEQAALLRDQIRELTKGQDTLSHTLPPDLQKDDQEQKP